MTCGTRQSWSGGGIGRRRIATVFGVLGLAAALSAPAGPAAASSQTGDPFAKHQLAARPMDPQALYPDGLTFDVTRNGSVIGRHQTTFAPQGDALAVSSRMTLSITVLGLTLFSYGYESTGTWRDGQPVAVQARIDDDGTVETVDARWTGDAFVVDGPKGRETAATPVFPTNHWNAAVLTEDRVLNTLTGGFNAVSIVPGPVERVVTGSGPREARRFDYTGELRASVWYDARGRWVKLRFEGRDGTPIEYVCRVCGDDQTAQAQ